MPPLNAATLLVNSLTLVMALGFLIIILWHDRQKPLNQFFAFFLFAVALWSIGSLLAITTSVLGTAFPLNRIAANLVQLGFSSASITVYALTASLVSVRPPRFRLIVLMSLVFLTLYQALLNFSNSTPANPNYQLHTVFFALFGGATLYLLWRYRARVVSLSLRAGIVLFSLGQGMGLLNPALQALSLSTILSSVAVLILGFGLIHQEIILPLRERTSQVEAMHTMSLAITSQLAVHTVIEQVAQQAGNWLKADAVGIFLAEVDRVQLAAVYGLPGQFVGLTLPPGTGVAGKVIQTRQTIRLQNYAQEWLHQPDLPLARETFGAVVCVPLVAGEQAIGALMVIAGRHNRAFQVDDVHLLEMLGAQAAVAIIHGQLFSNQQRLNQEVEAARNQLETVLTSTENPVIAVDRRLVLIFANAAAERLFPVLRYTSQPLTEVLPADVLPKDYIQAYRSIRRTRAYTYEVVHENRIFLSHLAALGAESRIEGWVAVLNDVTQLKELDRLKSEMVRMTSHDLKNPLQAAMANIDLLSDILQDHPDDDVQYSMHSIEKQLNRMRRIISGVLDIERIRIGAQKQHLCRPETIVQATIADMQSFASDRDIQLIVAIADDLPQFHGDAEQIERALSNLIENAVKFSPMGSDVQVCVYSQDNEIVFRVKDSGIGIPTDDQEYVFDSFFRANQRGAEHITGTGLGLHLVKTVVDNHKGRVWLESESQVGTTFYISLNAAPDSMILGDS